MRICQHSKIKLSLLIKDRYTSLHIRISNGDLIKDNLRLVMDFHLTEYSVM